MSQICNFSHEWCPCSSPRAYIKSGQSSGLQEVYRSEGFLRKELFRPCMRLVQEVDRFGELFTYRRVRLLVFWGEVGVRLTQNDTLGGTFASGLRERHFLRKGGIGSASATMGAQIRSSNQSSSQRVSSVEFAHEF